MELQKLGYLDRKLSAQTTHHAAASPQPRDRGYRRSWCQDLQSINCMTTATKPANLNTLTLPIARLRRLIQPDTRQRLQNIYRTDLGWEGDIMLQFFCPDIPFEIFSFHIPVFCSIGLPLACFIHLIRVIISSEKTSGTPGIKPRTSVSGSKFANHCDMLLISDSSLI